MFLLVFALPEEARVVRRRIKWTKTIAGIRHGVLAGHQVVLQPVGIGATRISALERVIDLTKPDLVISTGFAGATRSLLQPGDLVLATNYSNLEIGDVLRTRGIVDAAGPFVQVSKVAAAADKKALGLSQGSIAVDMESGAVANVCKRKKTPVVTVRMISDAIDEAIPRVFTQKKLPRVSEIGDATAFAARMLRLTARLADRLEALIESELGTAGASG